ncbi:MAG TPA: sigma-70 family RNA polymerase sigma factor [Planctomycetota bacterium]|nr:sigma-70 family RNA polymerase sigma factor [Planctomycetota bacterium]
MYDEPMSGLTRTCWTMIEAAAQGDAEERERFCSRYLPVVEAALTSRWKGRIVAKEISDATQDVFLECLKGGGALESVDRHHSSSFRSFLYGVTRNVAKRYEMRLVRRELVSLDQSGVDFGLADEATLEAEFDRAWAAGIMREVAERLTSWASGRGRAAQRRVEILRLRFSEGVSLRAIAEREGLPEGRIHKDYALARKEFLAMLRQVVAWHEGYDNVGLDHQCRNLLRLLSP